MTLAPDRTGYHARGEVAEPDVHRVPLRRFDATEPPTTAPTLAELDRATNVVLHHIAHQCWDADHHGRHRNPHLIHALITVDLGGRHLNPAGLRCLVTDWPIGGEFPTGDALDNYLFETRLWLRGHDYH